MGGLARVFALVALVLLAAPAVADGDQQRADVQPDNKSACFKVTLDESRETAVRTGTEPKAEVAAAGAYVAARADAGSCSKEPEKSAEDIQKLVDVVVWVAVTTARANGVPV